MHNFRFAFLVGWHRQAQTAAKLHATGVDVVAAAKEDVLSSMKNTATHDAFENPEASGVYVLTARKSSGAVIKADEKSFDKVYLSQLLGENLGPDIEPIPKDKVRLKRIHWMVGFVNSILAWPQEWRTKLDFMQAVENNHGKWAESPVIERVYNIPSWAAVEKMLLAAPVLSALKELNLKVTDHPYYVKQTLVGLESAHYRQTYRRIDNKPMEQSGLPCKQDEGSLSILEYARRCSSPSLASLELSRVASSSPRRKAVSRSPRPKVPSLDLSGAKNKTSTADGDPSLDGNPGAASANSQPGKSLASPEALKVDIQSSNESAVAAQPNHGSQQTVKLIDQPHPVGQPNRKSESSQNLETRQADQKSDEIVSGKAQNATCSDVLQHEKVSDESAAESDVVSGDQQIEANHDHPDANIAATLIRPRPEPSAASATQSIIFAVDQKVEGNFGGNGAFYPGVVESVNDDGTYNIRYDDGDSEANVAATLIRPRPEPSAASATQSIIFAVDQKVEGNFGGNGAFYPGVVESVNDDGTYNIRYDDGDSEANVAATLIRPRPEPSAASATQSIIFAVDQKVEGNFGGNGAFYPGVVESVNDDGTYNIRYDDGDSEANVAATLIRPRPEPSAASATQSIIFAVDQKVEGNFGGNGAFYPGVVESVNDDGTYNIRYDDGDSEAKVSPLNIRIAVTRNATEQGEKAGSAETQGVECECEEQVDFPVHVNSDIVATS